MYHNMRRILFCILYIYLAYNFILRILITYPHTITLYSISLVYSPIEDEMTLILIGAVLGALSGLAQIYANKYMERRRERREAAALAAAASGSGTVAAAGI